MKAHLAFAAAIILVTGTAHSQYAGINASVFNASGEFNRNIDRNPAGLSLIFLYPFGEQQLFRAGLEIGVAMYANKNYELDVPGADPVTIYEEDCFWTFHLIGQYDVYRTPLLQLYGEGSVGISSFFSEKHALGEDVEEYTEFKWHGTAFNAGLGGGLRLNISGLINNDGENYDRIWLDMAMAKMAGTRTHYRSASEKITAFDQANYTSLTNYTHIRVGVNVLLN